MFLLDVIRAMSIERMGYRRALPGEVHFFGRIEPLGIVRPFSRFCDPVDSECVDQDVKGACQEAEPSLLVTFPCRDEGDVDGGGTERGKACHDLMQGQRCIRNQTVMRTVRKAIFRSRKL